MKFRWLALFALGMLLSTPAFSQVSVYADLSFSKLTGGIATTTTDVLPGPTIGVTAQLGTKAHLKIYGDARGNFYGGSHHLEEIAVGPKVGLPLRRFEPYAEILVGFGRYNDGLGNSNSGTTDGQLEVNFGLDRRVSRRFDWRVFEFGYQQYYALGGEFNPKTFSTGVVYHFGAP